jgi:hypothetical protein
MNNSNDWHESQNDNYLNLSRTRLSQPKLKWVCQFTNIINSKFKEINGGSGCVDQSILLNDFGCNVGHFFRGIEDIKFPINYLGYDISETYLEIAKNRFGSKYFENLDIASDSIVKIPREADISVISATLEHIENYEAALRNIFLNTRHLVLMRTFVGGFSLKESCRTEGAISEYIIRQFTFEDIVRIPVELGWSFVEEVDVATSGEIRMTCNSTSIPRQQAVLVFSRIVRGEEYARFC